MDFVTVAAFALLALGVAGSLLPLLPSGALSLVGVLVYWWHTGDPGALLLFVLVGLAVTATVVDWLAGFVGAKASGLDNRTAVLAGVVGFVLMLPGGPLGLFVGVAGTVFAVRLQENGDVEESLREAAYATVGVLASAAMQLVLTGVVLAAMLWVQFG